MMWSWFLPASLLGVIMILTIRSMQEIGKWWGIPLLIGGLLSIMVIGLVSVGRGDLIRDMLVNFAPVGTPFYQAFEIVLLGILVAVIRLAFFHALLITGAGLALWLITRYLSKRSDPQIMLESEPRDDAQEEQVSGLPAPPPGPPLGSRPEDEEGPPSGIFG